MRKHGKLSKEARARYAAFKASRVYVDTDYGPVEIEHDALRSAGINLAIRNRDVTSVAIYGRPTFDDTIVDTFTRNGKRKVRIVRDPRRILWITDANTRGGIQAEIRKDRSSLTKRQGSTLSNTFRGKVGNATTPETLREMRDANTLAEILGEVKPNAPHTIAGVARAVYSSHGQSWRLRIAKIIDESPTEGYTTDTINFDTAFNDAVKGIERVKPSLATLAKDYPVLRRRVK